MRFSDLEALPCVMIDNEILTKLSEFQAKIDTFVSSRSWAELTQLLERRQCFLNDIFSNISVFTEVDKECARQLIQQVSDQDKKWVNIIQQEKKAMQRQRLNLKRSRASIKAYE